MWGGLSQKREWRRTTECDFLYFRPFLLFYSGFIYLFSDRRGFFRINTNLVLLWCDRFTSFVICVWKIFWNFAYCCCIVYWKSKQFQIHDPFQDEVNKISNWQFTSKWNFLFGCAENYRIFNIRSFSRWNKFITLTKSKVHITRWIKKHTKRTIKNIT